MSGKTKICRVCGREYIACKTPNTESVFRWKDVACSRECGAEYLRRVLVARDEIVPEENTLESEFIYGFEEEIDEEYIDGFGED